jgi:hypothetical protein
MKKTLKQLKHDCLAETNKRISLIFSTVCVLCCYLSPLFYFISFYFGLFVYRVLFHLLVIYSFYLSYYYEIAIILLLNPDNLREHPTLCYVYCVYLLCYVAIYVTN